jgi:hypothetical protein
MMRHELIPLTIGRDQQTDVENQTSYGTFYNDEVADYVAENGLYSLPYGILRNVYRGTGVLFEADEEEDEEIPTEVLQIINKLFCLLIAIFSFCSFVAFMGYIILNSDLSLGSER